MSSPNFSGLKPLGSLFRFMSESLGVSDRNGSGVTAKLTARAAGLRPNALGGANRPEASFLLPPSDIVPTMQKRPWRAGNSGLEKLIAFESRRGIFDLCRNLCTSSGIAVESRIARNFIAAAPGSSMLSVRRGLWVLAASQGRLPRQTALFPFSRGSRSFFIDVA